MGHEERPLFTGDPDNIDGFVDWRGTEEEVIDDANQFLPDGSLSCDVSDSNSDSTDRRIRFQGSEGEISLSAQPQNNFRVLLQLAALLQTAYEIRLFRCTADSDTNGFLIRPASWWSEYRASHTKQYADLFQDIGELSRLWDLDKLPKRF